MNSLQFETSPYLLQHASNPINWYPWKDEALEKAKEEQKLMIISIGYFSCHWCQVMEEETFTDTLVAQVMNDNFISIKVDREERPDIDAIYTAAAERMTGSSGWPLNIIATPDGTPLFAGTYFENSDWRAIVERAAYLYQNDPDQVLADAQNLASQIAAQTNKQRNTSQIQLEEVKNLWLAASDLTYGGVNTSEKFPNTPYLNAFFYYTFYYPSAELDSFVGITLDRMALGGLFDHLGGGFSRYSTDNEWRIPHFEKMLYDNAQLLSIYSKAYRKFNDPLYLSVATRTADFLQNEMKAKGHGYYSSINAVSGAEEGKYYTWSFDQIKELKLEENTLELFDLKEEGNWENGLNVLASEPSDKEAYISWIESQDFQTLVNSRAERDLPTRDTKVITGWNALLIDGFVELFRATQEYAYLEEAKDIADFMIEDRMDDEFNLSRTGVAFEALFLEDYSLFIQSLIKLYQFTFNEDYLTTAKDLTIAAIANFKDEVAFKTSNQTYLSFTTTYLTDDTNLPSGNAAMVDNLIKLSSYYYDEHADWKYLAQNLIN
ncbi:MAG TPA: thioredoxin domain-containing protein, partial [Roseivirga sp.]